MIVVVCYDISWYTLSYTIITATKESDDDHPLLIEHRKREVTKRTELYQ